MEGAGGHPGSFSSQSPRLRLKQMENRIFKAAVSVFIFKLFSVGIVSFLSLGIYTQNQ